MSECYADMRADQQILIDWIKPGSRVLDLGCGDGALLHCLMQEKEVSGYGIDYEDERIL
ncbi:MAG: methionine biosynthesis protein MetW, partial [Gammaproteobacteria bacterium]